MDIVERLRKGAFQTNRDIIDAADTIQQQAERIRELEAALDHIARVALGTTTRSRRMLWVHERAKSALNRDENWRAVKQPKGYHDNCEALPLPKAMQP